MQCTNIKILANNYSHVMANNQKIANMKYYFYIMSKYIFKKNQPFKMQNRHWNFSVQYEKK